MNKKNELFAVLLIACVSLISSCTNKDRRDVIIFHAGSLSVPLKEAAKEYMEQNPDVNIILEGAGSVACTRKITELGKPCDIMASADYRVIEEFLMPRYTDWNIWFATNEMVIAFTNESKYSDIIDSSNWYEILSREDVVYGRSDPDSDPCGYRTVLLFELSELYYSNDSIADVLLAKDRNMIRPKEVDLVALLETKALDYIAQYKSVSEQHGLKYITLPDEINLSEPEFEDTYSSVQVGITGKQPGEKVTIKGSSMIYGLTILNNAPNREDAVNFLNFFLGNEGQRILEENGQTPLNPHLEGEAAGLPPGMEEIFVR